VSDWDRFHRKFQAIIQPVIDRLDQFNLKYMEDQMSQLDKQAQAEAEEISDFIQSFIAERLPAGLTPEMKLIQTDIMLEAIEWGAKWQERKSIEERRIIGV